MFFLINSKWQWINIIKHLLILLIVLKHMFEFGSADNIEDQLEIKDDMITTSINRIIEFAEQIGKELNLVEEQVIGHGCNAQLIKLNRTLYNIKVIGQDVLAITESHVSTKIIIARVHDLGHEIEKLKVELDGTFNYYTCCIDYPAKIKEYLEEMVGVYLNLVVNLENIFELEFVIIFQNLLLQRKYAFAKKVLNHINSPDKVIEVLKNVYEKEKDFDGYLYLAGIVKQLPRRYVIYNYIFEDIISNFKGFRPNETDKEHEGREFLFTCNPLKLIYKLHDKVVKNINENDKLYEPVNQLKEEIVYLTSSLTEKEYYNKGGTVELEEERFIKNNTVLTDIIYYNPKKFPKYSHVEQNYYLDNLDGDIIECWHEAIVPLFNHNLIVSAMPSSYDKDKCLKHNKNNERQSFTGTELIISLKEQNYKNALRIYNKLRSDKSQIKKAIEEFYNEFNDIDTLIHFADLLNRKERADIYNPLYDAIDKTKLENIRDMLILYEKSVQLNREKIKVTYVDDLKKAINSVIKNDIIQHIDEDHEMYVDLRDTAFNKITMYTKDGRIIVIVEYYVAKENKVYVCYLKGTIALNTVMGDYDGPYNRYIRRLGDHVINTFKDIFMVIIQCLERGN